MDRRTLLAITLCFIIFMAWQKLYLEPRMPAPGSQNAQTAPVSNQQSTPGAPLTGSSSTSVGQGAPTQTHPAQTLQVKSEAGDAVVGDNGYFFVGWNLKSYRLGITPEAAAVDLKSVTNEPGEVELAFDDPAYAYLNQVQGNLVKTPQGVLWTFENQDVKLTREVRATENQPYVDVLLGMEFKTKRPSYAFLSLTSRGMEKDPEERDRQLAYWSNQSIERYRVKDSVKQKEVATPVKYIAASNRYFVMALVNEGPIEPKGLLQPLPTGGGRMSLVYPMAGNSMSIPIRAYFGPKELNLLRQVEPTLDHVVDFGMFTIIAYPLLKLLKWIYQFLGNYGVAIILVTLILKIATYPLTYKSMKSMKEMAKVQPQLQKLKEKYKDDRETLNREMLSLMRSHGYNPAAGCLPIVIQMPIFFALYQVLYNSIELYHAPFMLWIRDLSVHDPFYVTPILLSLTMFIQQKLSPNTATDPMQARMLQFMPLIFGAMMMSLPSGLTVYMLVNALASIAQQLVLNKKLNPANVPAVAARAR